MPELVAKLQQSHSRAFNEGVAQIFNALFEADAVTVNSHDAVDMIQQKVGKNLNKTDDGENIVGLAAQAGMGDESLPNEMDQIVNSVNNDIATTVDIPPLPTEADVPDLPPDNPPAPTEETPDFTADISDTPPPDDMDLPIDGI